MLISLDRDDEGGMDGLDFDPAAGDWIGDPPVPAALGPFQSDVEREDLSAGADTV